jgi:heme/copper-type cytochrome/quinol oxidase subunit 2
VQEGHPFVARRRVLVWAGAVAAAVIAPLRAANLFRQDQAPARRDFTITAKNYAFSPDRIEVARDERVHLTIEGADQVHSFAMDEFRIARRIPLGASAVVDFRADRVGSFTYYCNISADPGCKAMRGTLVVSK